MQPPETNLKITQSTPTGRPPGEKPAALYLAPLGPTAESSWEPIHVHRGNYDKVLRGTIRPRFEKEVDDRISGRPGGKLMVSLDLSGGRTPEWPHLIAQQVPPIRVLQDKIRRLEEMRLVLSRQAVLRNELRRDLIMLIRGRNAAPALPPPVNGDAPKGNAGKRK
jgi:hypothetical protein